MIKRPCCFEYDEKEIIVSFGRFAYVLGDNAAYCHREFKA